MTLIVQGDDNFGVKSGKLMYFFKIFFSTLRHGSDKVGTGYIIMMSKEGLPKL